MTSNTQYAQWVPDTQEMVKIVKAQKDSKVHDDSISTSDVSSPRVASVPLYDVEINDSFERVYVPENITAENVSQVDSPVPMQLVQRSSQAKPNIKASFSSLESGTVSIPCPAESDTDLESAEPIVSSANLSLTWIELHTKLGKNLSVGTI